MEELEQRLVDWKVQDYVAQADRLPERGGPLSNMLAWHTGIAAGRLLRAYTELIDKAADGGDRAAVRDYIDGLLKEYMWIDYGGLSGSESEERICGLKTFSYVGMVDADLDLYACLLEDCDMSSEIEGEETIAEAAYKSPERYKEILRRKEEAIMDYNVLMGHTADESRYEELMEAIPSKLASYYDRIIQDHRREGWNLVALLTPYERTVADPLGDGFYRDTVAAMVQEAVDESFGFTPSEGEAEESALKLMREDVVDLWENDSIATAYWERFAGSPRVWYLYGIATDRYSPFRFVSPHEQRKGM